MNTSASPSGNNPGMPDAPPFPVLGIGASAGGLQALQQFLEGMPSDCGAAIVVILHLSATHESNAHSILQRYTKMQVLQVLERMKLEPNVIYVIPPAHSLVMEDGHLELADRLDGGKPIAVDLLFRTMAEAHGERAVCVVLSGMGSDGAVGVTRVKELGGMTFAQSPDDAEYPSMPRAAIATGNTDFVLPAVEMAQRLVDLWLNAKQIRMPPATDAAIGKTESRIEIQAEEEALQIILKLVRIRTAHDFRQYKKATILRRLERRLQVRGLPTLSAYSLYLEEHPDETELLLQDMLISVTNFFRDRAAFEALERDVLPDLFANRRDGEPVRVWVAGCATGEEAYSVSILLREYSERLGAPVDIQIFATDIDERAIATARTGLYPSGIITDLPPARLRDFFTKEGDAFRVVKSVREPVLFATHNILRDPPFSRLDLVCCRNVLIYLDRAAQKNIIETFHFALKPGGFLFLGNSETDDSAPELFTGIDKKNRIYRTLSGAHMSHSVPPFPLPAVASRAKHSPGDRSERRRPSVAQIHQRALEQLSVPSVLIGQDYGILHTSPSVTRFLEHQAGDPSHNLLANVHPDLRLELRNALFRATQSNADVENQPARLKVGDAELPVRISVRHYTDDVRTPLLLVIFEELSTFDVNWKNSASPDAELIVTHLEGEIRRYKEDLQATIERSEVSTEELKASNEELQTINEELRSATEELETSKEELQSMNEELITLNDELRRKVEETDASNDYLNNLIAATDIATIFIDRGMRVLQFTPRAKDLFNLISSDIGRPLTDIRHRLDYESLVDDANESFHSLRIVERKIQSDAGKHYLARVLPYRTKSDKIDGAVLSFIDITALHEAEQRIKASEERLRLAAESTKEYAIITIDDAGIVTSWNAGANRIFGYDEAEILGETINIIYTPQDRAEGIPEKERAKARANGKAEDERWHLRKNGTTFYCSGAVSVMQDKELKGFVKIARDMTGNKRVEVEREAQLKTETAERRKMQAANELKDQFLAVMSHELKHPLNLIHVNAELLSHFPETQQSASMRRSVDIIQRTVLSQAKIIDDLLDLSRARTGKMTLNLVKTLMAPSIGAIVEAARQTALAKEITIDLHCEDENIAVLCDPVRLEQITWNLLSNAVKFTPEGGLITVSLVQGGGFAALSVTDSGEGIASEFLPKVFEMFSQGIHRRPHSNGGMGIGLALVRDLAKAHGGYATAESDGLGRGARFTVALPLYQGSEIVYLQNRSDAPMLQDLRLLLVDDAQDALDPLAALLRLMGATVEAVNSGAAALQALEKSDFDLLISDIGMEEMDGYELIQQVRNQPELALLPAIALTGYGRPLDEEKALALGFNAHLPKPTSTVDLCRVIINLRKGEYKVTNTD